MAEDCTDGDYLGAYSRFFTEFNAKVKPHDQLPVSVSSYNVTKAELTGEIINITLQYLNKTQCPPCLQAHLVQQVVQETNSMCKKQPKDCGFKLEEKTYTSLKLMQAVVAKVNEICTRYLDNSRLALLPPPPSTPLPQVAAGGNKNCRRAMEDRYVVLYDLHTTFGIQDESIVNYYAVFDGHAGQDAAVYCATHLHQYLAESIYYPTSPESALYHAFVITDAQFAEKYKTQKVCGGTTAVSTLIKDDKLYVAWVGDSSAMLIKRDSVIQLVNPHTLHREDERQRIEAMGGAVMPAMGILRVNGELSVSRAIGDVRYKPYVTGTPEINCITLDGTEDFLVLATDGLTDYVDPEEILTILYHEIQRNPNGLKRAHHILLQWAKYADSRDNITVIVVLLTPASEIAARHKYVHPYYRRQVNDILEEMNSNDKPMQRDIEYAHNAITSNNLKQTMLSQDSYDNHRDEDILEASNGKHENGDGDYDYSDLGPETNVDTIDDVNTMPVRNLSYEFYKDNDEVVENDDDDDDDDDENDDDDDRLADKDSDVMDHASINETTVIEVARSPLADCNFQDTEHENDEIPTNKEVQDDVQEMISEKIDEQISNEVRASFKENLDHEETLTKAIDHIEKSQDKVDEAGPIDYEQSPPSPQAEKPLQHALIQEADNVADSEDSEDEWNYYRVDPNKDKESAAPVDELRETRNEFENEKPTSPVEDTEPKIHSEDIVEDIKCEDPKDDSSELINTEINAEDKEKESKEEENLLVEEQDKSKDMDFQLNPDAAEFIPVSPQFTAPKRNLQDFPVSGSPFKRISQMDDIQIPSESEFEKEVCQRPREVESEDKKYRNGDHVQQGDFTDYINDQQKTGNFINTLDDSEISSTKAEYGDADSTSFLTATEFHRTGISTVDDSFSSTEHDYDIAKDPMAMSFTPSDFEAAFDKGVDLNAVHDLSNSDLDENNCDMEKEEERSQCEEPKYEFINNLECEQPTEIEQPPQESEVSEKPAELLNLSSQQEECEDTFIKHTDKPQETIDLLNLQTSPSMMEQQEIIKDAYSPSTENCSTEFESEKEPVSVDNEQLLSPSSVDIDKTKPIDEASDDALPTDLQKEASTKEIDTPSSLSPVPDGIENDLATPAESADVPSAPIQCSLHADAPEFMPGEQYNFHSYSVETNEVHQPPMETGDIYQARSTEISSVYQPYSTETNDPFEINKNTLLDEDEQFEQKKELVPMDTKPTEEKLLVFAEEQETCVKGQLGGELTPPLSPHEVEEEQSQNITDLICPIQSTEEKLDEIESKGPMEADILETKPEEEIESAKEAVLSLSESMQEFTGLESQLQPKEEEILESCVVPEAEVEISTKEELKIEIKSEELIEPIMVEEEYKVVEKQEVEEVPSLTKELLEVEKAVEVVESTETVQPVEDMKAEEATESKVTEIAAAATTAVAAAGIIAAAATSSATSAIQSKTKAKTTSKSTKATSKTTTPKSTPTSPSKASISSSKTSTTTAKKSTTVVNRPKDLDTLKKPAVSSTTVKTSPLKATSKTVTTTTSKPTTRTSSGSATKPKPTTLSSKPAVEKKATPNGDVKPLSKPATTTKAVSKTPSATKTTLVKASSSTTRTLTGTSTTKPRPATATTTTKTNTTAKSAAVTTTTSSSARPKTAPNVGSTMKTTARASTPKSPMIDKQVKETANKQISMARTSTVSKTRQSGSNSTTSMVRRVSSTTKTTTASQVKKTSTVSKTSGKTSVGAKTPTDKGKVIQNGVSEKVEINTIIDDVPKKDVSPVITPNDNQLIMTSD